MDTKLFDRLVESMSQMNKIIDGERAFSREFIVDALCVRSLDPADKPRDVES